MTISQVTPQFRCLLPVSRMHAGCTLARTDLAQFLNADAKPLTCQITVSSLTVMQPSDKSKCQRRKNCLKKAFKWWERGINVTSHQLLSVTKHARCCVQQGAIKKMDCVCVVPLIAISHWWWKNQDLVIKSGLRHSFRRCPVSPVEHSDMQPAGSGVKPTAFVPLERALWHQSTCGSGDSCKSAHVRWKIIQMRTITRAHAQKPDGRGITAITATSLEMDNFMKHLNSFDALTDISHPVSYHPHRAARQRWSIKDMWRPKTAAQTTRNCTT